MPTRRRFNWFFGCSVAVSVLCASPGLSQIQVVNMIPAALSGETNQDSEPNLAVNLANPLQIAGSAFTPNPAGSGNAPIFVSTDGGVTWVLNNTVPSGNAMTGDITLRFGGTTGTLYGGILRGGSGLRLNILRTDNFVGAAAMTVLVDRQGSGVDQPYVQAATVLGGGGNGSDRVFVGNNDFGSTRSASIDRSLDAATAAAPAGFASFRIEARTTSGQDGPPIRPAVHLDGTVYGIFNRWTAFASSVATVDVVVVRDDNWGAGTTPFTALTDASDGLAGRRVVTGRTVPFINSSQATFGQERFVASNISIAVDPRSSDIVYIAWADRVGATDYTLHVRRSTDRGVTWSAADLRTITNATNPALAINSHGVVGFLYQQLTGTGTTQRWVTHLERTSNEFATTDDRILANVLASAPASAFIPYIGDYVHLAAVGKDFFGIFSAANTPVMANFPQGVTFQRNVDFGSGQLRNLANTANVAVSIDPFFFRATGVVAGDDFYARDWTDSPTSGDSGVEPSTHPVFYQTGDVWNRRGTLPGSFPNDQPEGEDAGNGMGTVGDNWAFARIRRNVLPASGSQTVTAHFLVSKLGTGSNFVDAGVADPDVAFPDPDPTLAFGAALLGPQTTPAYKWHLNAVSSTHLCLAVELTTPADPFVAPSLVGNAPGWFTGTDLRVISDNNKAQRNLGLSTTPARGVGGSITLYGLAHNAALAPRSMLLRLYVPPSVLPRLVRGGRVEVIGGGVSPIKSGGTITLPKMQPGENRWVGVTFPVPEGAPGETLAVAFDEIVAGSPVNGFVLGAVLAPTGRALQSTLRFHRSVFIRLDAGFRLEGAAAEWRGAEELARGDAASEKGYLEFVRAHATAIRKVLNQFILVEKAGDPFGLSQAIVGLLTAAKSGDLKRTAVAHAALLEKADAFVTMRQIARGDPADILQNVRWQQRLYRDKANLRRLKCASRLQEASTHFIDDYGRRKVRNQDYARHVSDVLDCLRETGRALGRGANLEELITRIEGNMGHPQALQKAHRDYLLRLEGLAK